MAEKRFNARTFLTFGIVISLVWTVAFAVVALVSGWGMFWLLAAWGLVVAGWSAVRLRMLLPKKTGLAT